jgi:Flp pilus assembly pilin Flp
VEKKKMDGMKNFLREESGTAEAASSVVMIGMLSSGLSGGLSGIWNNLSNNHSAMILLGVGLVFGLWFVIKK